jgi:hypothetical protein
MTAELITAMLQVIEDLTRELAASRWQAVTAAWPPPGVPFVAQLRSGRYAIGQRHGAGFFTDGRRIALDNVVRAMVLP